VVFPPAGDAVYGEGHVSCGITAGRNGIGLYERSRAGAATALSIKMGIAGWTHLAVVYKEGVPSIYVNGKFVQSGKNSGRVVHPGINEANLGYGAPSFNGDMTEPELFREALDAGRIRALSEKGLPAPGEPPAIEFAGSTNPEVLIWRDGGYVLRDAAGRESTTRISGTSRAIPVAGAWEVFFPPKRGAPPQVTLPTLTSLHRHSDPGVRHFSGTATYSTSLTFPPQAVSSKQRIYLDLGRVEVIAEVHMNGRSMGILWKPPYRLDVTESVRSGGNKLEVLVTNLWPNRLIGDEFLPAENEYSAKGTNIKDIGEISRIPDWFLQNRPKPGPRITFSTWKHYSQDSPLLESGLLGPVLLRIAVRQPLEAVMPERLRR
jgi:hypothetical protein